MIDMTEQQTILEVVADGVAQLTLNRPDAMNTMTPAFLDDVLAQLERVTDDPTIRVMILTGAGRAFCAGGDLKRGPGGAVAGDPPLASQTGRLRNFMRSSQLLRDMPKITISAINGACAGAGFSWACATDLRFASSKARFATAFRNAGLSGDFGGTWLLPRIVGGGRARDLYLRSKPITAQEALDMGLVSGIEEPDVLLDAVLEIARDLAAAAPLALPLIKQNLNDADEISFAEALDREARRHSSMVATADGTEAARAFTEKRQPKWTGK
ncbi:enoyl-CoA hydratase/isomerase family protein [Paracoccus jeotgali]|uniref:Enoyl-CoA hydratase n=1 Tax=Paracoccus jeotgali TaxID=2065379 RepID=A0A2K9MMA8_9RHOB|nr:enoyl-CoA hydratase-related protein [Paracoccus jeotgali]AUM75755.1 enoyl-CoA hydratase [Paracoccus jeotgali]